MAAFYRAVLADFLADSPKEILGALLHSYQHNELQKRQTKAWEKEIAILKAACAELIQSCSKLSEVVTAFGISDSPAAQAA